MSRAAQQQRAQRFRELHVRGSPVVLYNIWDAGSAKVVADAGSQALATSSNALSASHGLPDGQILPLELLLDAVRRIVDVIGSLPLSVDFEGAYATAPHAVGENVAQVIEAGATGINLEDQVVREGSSWTNGSGMYSVAEQVERIRAARAAADAVGVSIVINARTDLFLKEPDLEKHELLVAEALQRAAAYADAGADCLFIPALQNRMDIVARVCAEAPLPINAMHLGRPAGLVALAAAGVARLSHGSLPHRLAHERLAEQARSALAALHPQSKAVADAGTLSSPLGAIEQLFRGMRLGCAETVRAVLAADARFVVLRNEGKIQAQSVEPWVKAIASSDGKWDEQIYDVEVRVDDRMAAAWVPYTFYLDGAVSHCGVNSIELLRDQEGWKITQLSDTRRDPSHCNGCPDPLAIAAGPKL